MGRPRIYQKPRSGVIIYFENGILAGIDEKARENGLSRIEYVNALIAQGDSKAAIELGLMYKELNSEVINLRKNNEDNIHKNKELVSKIESIISKSHPSSIYMIIEPDEYAIKAVESIKKDCGNAIDFVSSHGQPTNKVIEIWSEKALIEMETILLKDGKTIKNKNIAKQMIKKLMIQLEKDRQALNK